TYSVKEELSAGVEAELELGSGLAHFKTLRIDSGGAINCNPAPSENDLAINIKLSAGQSVIWEKSGAESLQKPLILEVTAPLAEVLITKSHGQWGGGISLESEGIKLPGLQLKTGKLKAELPLMRLAARGGSGTVRLQQICFQNKDLMDVDLTVKDIGNAVALDGSLKQRILPGADWKCQAFLQLQPAFTGKVTVSFGPYNLTEPLQAGSYFPKLDGMSLSGCIEGGGEFNFRPDSKAGKAALHLTDGVFKSKQANLTAEGIESILVFPALPELRTLPLQVLRCKTLQAGTVKLTKLNAEYQIEPGNAFLLENFSANWCGGRIYTQALRITPGQQNLKAVLYCDGLILSQVLAEMGIANAVGAGAIHGRMPLSFGPQGIVLEPGYLYSEPGGKQNIRIEGMEKVFEGFPPESVQASQAEVALEALKNFDYEWVKINFANTGDTLRLEMQLNGRPAEPLPFKYDSNRGGFVRVNGEKAIFQGIRLDVNTNIPLNQMLRFNNNIKNLFGGKKP
ncbi:MAG: intermembrane phospholipid transport protein YdbH family protein, partial [Victivallaceae bacterium]